MSVAFRTPSGLNERCEVRRRILRSIDFGFGEEIMFKRIIVAYDTSPSRVVRSHPRSVWPGRLVPNFTW